MRSLRLTFSVLVLINAASLSAVLFSTVSLAQAVVPRSPTADNATVPDNSLGNLPKSDSARTRTADNSKLPVAAELVTGSERRNESGAVAMDSTSFVFLLFPLVANSSGIVPVSMVVGDVNRDDKPDLIAFGQDGSYAQNGVISVLLGNGDGTFQPAVTYSTGGFGVVSVTVVDVNGDGKPDLVVGNCSVTTWLCEFHGSVGVLLGNGDGTFQPVVTVDAGGGVSALTAADVNGDGKADLLVNVTVCGNQCVPTLSVMLGNGDGTFQPAQFYSQPILGTQFAVADLNGDGKPDLVAIGEVLLGNGDGTFQPVQGYYPGGDARSLAVGDVNGDGKPDLVTANLGGRADGTVGVLLGNGDGTFQTAVTYPAPAPVDTDGPFAVALGDVNADGKLDIAVGGSGEGVMLGNGDGTFGPIVFLGCCYVTSVALADVNGDGRPDMAILPFDDVAVLLNNNGAPPTTTSLVSNVNPVTYKQPVTFTATVVRQGGGTANGLVYFGVGPGLGGNGVPLVGNKASFTVTYTSTGPEQMAAAYGGDLNQSAASLSNTITETVRGTSTTKETSSQLTSMFGQPVTFTAVVTSRFGAIPDGETVTFFDGRTTLASVPLADQQAAYTTSTLAGGAHSIRATYVGDASHAPSTGLVNQTVDKFPTTTGLTSSSNPSVYKHPVTFTVTVASAGPTPTGKVKFMDGSTAIGSATLSGGTATLTKSKLAVGSHTITAEYTGDSASTGSTSPALDQVVNP